ncbi:MAG: geranylgeranyl reductase [Euryarchaeota archaeon RBG_16_67_27]|nr:MAG: geranylgeranyl reductase [Euryarchaeota archaeon RBG_16_67_27]
MVKSIEYDVVVVGAGPAGSMTARYAALSGVRTLLIEKRQEIGSPVRCGEGLARHFVEDTKLPFDRKWVAQEVKGAKIFSPNGTELTIEEAHAGNEVGIVLERDAFDKAVAKEAARAGADILLKTTATAVLKEDGWIRGVRCKQLEDEFVVKAKCVVAADGYESQVGRWAGFRTLLKAGDVTGTLQYRLTNIGRGHDFPDYCEFWLGTCAPAGYIWVFPKDDVTANVGIGVSLDRLKHRHDIKGFLDRWLAQDPRMARAQPLDMVTGGVSTCAPISKTVGNGVALVGDAARMIDPITGGGIGNGMTAGMMLGQTLGRCLEKDDFSEAALQEYEKGWRAKLENGLYRNWLAKNKLVTLSDQEFDDIVKTLADVGVTKLSVRAILKVLKDTNPELVAKFAEFI